MQIDVLEVLNEGEESWPSKLRPAFTWGQEEEDDPVVDPEKEESNCWLHGRKAL